MLKLYPDAVMGRLWRLALDILAILWAGGWALAGWFVYNLVLALQVIADGITSTGRTFNSWVDSFRNSTPRNIPGLSSALLGIADALQRNAGSPLIQQGTEAHQRIEQLAIVFGLVTAAVPILIVAGLYTIWRWRDAREMAAAEDFVIAAASSGRVEEARAVLAHRAVASLSFRQLMRASPDPIGDLDSRRYDALAAAMARRVGLRPLPPAR